MLDIGNNMIEKIENISHLKNLEEFWVSLSLAGSLPSILSLIAAPVTVRSDCRRVTIRSRISTTWTASWLYYLI